MESGRIRQKVMDIYKTRRQVEQARKESFALGQKFDRYKEVRRRRAAALREQEEAYSAACRIANGDDC